MVSLSAVNNKRKTLRDCNNLIIKKNSLKYLIFSYRAKIIDCVLDNHNSHNKGILIGRQPRLPICVDARETCIKSSKRGDFLITGKDI